MNTEYIMHRKMKFWEVISAFRESEDLMISIFNQDEWREPYYEWYQSYNDLVDTQNREILDSLVPNELTSEIAKGITETYYLDELSRNLRTDKVGMSDESSIRAMTTLEVHDSFGGAVIEEIKEKGSLVVPNAV